MADDPAWAKEEGTTESPITAEKKTLEETKDADAPMSLLEQKRSMKAIDHPPEIDRNPLKFPDLAFGIAWIVAVVGMIYVAIAYGAQDVSDKAEEYDDDEKQAALEHLTKILILVFLFALFCAQMSMSVMMRCGGFMIHVGLIGINAFLIVSGAIKMSKKWSWRGPKKRCKKPNENH